ncbi:hypothetical protein [Elizabethkingia meningoseptica]|uniref:hypothetical protein n=1 Tax=Elizabethkingia meningoseptica TaxID=238 RepID=UPI00301AAED1
MKKLKKIGLFAIIISLSAMLASCNNDNRDENTGSSAKAAFSFVTPHNKEIKDSIVYIPSGYTVTKTSPSSTVITNSGTARFKNTSAYSGNTNNYVFMWTLSDSADNSVVQTGNTENFDLDLSAKTGKYKLKLIIYDKSTYTKTSAPLTSLSKTVVITDDRLLKSITIDSLSNDFAWPATIPKDANAEIFVRIYKTEKDQTAGQNPVFESKPVSIVNNGKINNIIIPVTGDIHLPVWRGVGSAKKEDYFFQLNYTYNGKSQVILRMLPSVDYETGFLSSDKSRLMDRRKFTEGTTSFTVISEFDYEHK